MGVYLDAKQQAANLSIFEQRKPPSEWKASMQLVAKAQAVLWHRTPVAVRQQILMELQAERDQK
jgi:hypothetical protein